MEDIYTFRLQKEEFDRILQGKKDIQLAINDSKRKSLAVGNQISFKPIEDETVSAEEDSEEEKEISATIEQLMYFDSFEEAAQMLGKERCGFKQSSTFDKATDLFLSKESFEQIEKNGIVAIVFKMIEKV